MDKKQQQELGHMRRVMEERFNPTMFHTKQDREVIAKGPFKAIMLPKMKVDFPMGFFTCCGFGMLWASLFLAIGSSYKQQRRRMDMLGFRIGFQVLTIYSLVAGTYLSDLRKKNNEKLDILAKLQAGELV